MRSIVASVIAFFSFNFLCLDDGKNEKKRGPPPSFFPHLLVAKQSLGEMPNFPFKFEINVPYTHSYP